MFLCLLLVAEYFSKNIHKQYIFSTILFLFWFKRQNKIEKSLFFQGGILYLNFSSVPPPQVYKIMKFCNITPKNTKHTVFLPKISEISCFFKIEILINQQECVRKTEKCLKVFPKFFLSHKIKN